MLSSVSLTNLAEPEPEPEENLGSPSSTRGLAYSLPLRCVSVDSDGKTLRASGSLDGTTSVGVLPIRSERQAEFFRRKLDSVSSLPRLSTPLIEPDEPDATQFRMDDETGYAEIPWRELPARVPSDATLSRVYRRTRAQERVEAEVTTGLPPLQPQVSVSHSEAEADLSRTSTWSSRTPVPRPRPTWHSSTCGGLSADSWKASWTRTVTRRI